MPTLSPVAMFSSPEEDDDLPPPAQVPKKRKPAIKGKSKPRKPVIQSSDEETSGLTAAAIHERTFQSSPPSSDAGGSQRTQSKKRKQGSKDRLLFTADQEQRLVEWYEASRVLYDKSFAGYKFAVKKQEAVEAIAKELGTTVHAVNTWKTSVRTQYVRLIKPGASGTEAKVPTDREQWILSSFGFLRDSVRHRPGTEVQAAKSSARQTPVHLSSSEQEEDVIPPTQASTPDVEPSQVFPGTSARPKRKKTVTPAADFGGILQDLRQIVSTSATAPPAAQGPSSRSSCLMCHPPTGSPAMAAWVASCSFLFSMGMDLPEDLQLPLMALINSKVYEAKQEANMRKQRQQQQQAQPQVFHQYHQGPAQQPRPPHHVMFQPPAPPPSHHQSAPSHQLFQPAMQTQGGMVQMLYSPMKPGPSTASSTFDMAGPSYGQAQAIPAPSASDASATPSSYSGFFGSPTK